ncbi:MAG: DUF3572 family protein [Sphingopyxis sp.]
MLRDKLAKEPVDPHIMLLRALAWICGDGDRAGRFINLTGVDPDDLRQRAGDADILAAAGQFLADHEPDLVSCAHALDCAPAALVNAIHNVRQGRA